MRPAAALAALALAGCGADRTPVADLDDPVPVPGRDVVERDGVRIELPRGWQRQEGPAPLVASASSGPVTVAVWRYPRTEPLPQDEAALAEARRTLLAAARARDPSIEVQATELTEVGGSPAIAVRARGRVDGRPRVLRSTHVYAAGAEVVIDGFAPERHVAVLEDDVLRPLLREAEVREP